MADKKQKVIHVRFDSAAFEGLSKYIKQHGVKRAYKDLLAEVKNETVAKCMMRKVCREYGW